MDLAFSFLIPEREALNTYKASGVKREK